MCQSHERTNKSVIFFAGQIRKKEDKTLNAILVVKNQKHSIFG